MISHHLNKLMQCFPKCTEQKITRNDAKCSDVMTALKPTTGTRAANSVPNTTCQMSNNTDGSKTAAYGETTEVYASKEHLEEEPG